VPGNHEFYGGEKQEIIEFLRSAGITVLADSTVLTAGGKVIIAGRDDRTNKDRMPLDILLSKVDRNKPVILMDHQPVNLNEVESAGIDISVSGHTHNGQFWPGNLIVKWMYDHGYGYMKKSRTHFIVSSGLGLWGPKYRIGTVSEIVSVKLKL
ncbi:MAG: metallophosphoesterase, partial [Bacteroidales bacterium]|nr:metallophosphoesterase [Bacteroidales bacterium]